MAIFSPNKPRVPNPNDGNQQPRRLALKALRSFAMPLRFKNRHPSHRGGNRLVPARVETHIVIINDLEFFHAKFPRANSNKWDQIWVYEGFEFNSETKAYNFSVEVHNLSYTNEFNALQPLPDNQNETPLEKSRRAHKRIAGIAFRTCLDNIANVPGATIADLENVGMIQPVPFLG